MFNTDSKDITYNLGKQEQLKNAFSPIEIADGAIPNTKIFPSKVISGYHATADESTALAWEHHMLILAQEIPEVASVYWCSGEWLPDNSSCKRRSHQATYFMSSLQLRVYRWQSLVWLPVLGTTRLERL